MCGSLLADRSRWITDGYRTQFLICNCQSQIYWGLLKTSKLETGSRQDKIVLYCLQLCSHRRHGQDKTVLSCPCRRCEQYNISRVAAALRKDQKEYVYLIIHRRPCAYISDKVAGNRWISGTLWNMKNYGAYA